MTLSSLHREFLRHCEIEKRLAPQTITAYLRGELSPIPQRPGGQTYTPPSEDQIARMTQRSTSILPPQ